MPVATEPRPATLPLRGGKSAATVRVHPILTAEIHAPSVHTDKPSGPLAPARIAAALLGPRGRWNWLPVPAFLIEHPTAGAILIDTGLHPVCASDVSANMGRAAKLIYQVRMEHDQALRFQLPARGIQPNEVRLVILTHMHVDHASAVVEFPDATFLVDAREWAAAAEGGVREGYHHRQFDHAFDWRLLDYGAQSVESFAGFGQTIDLFGDGSVRLISTPGHTRGHQSVLLRTAEREILVVGDAAYTERELRGEWQPLLVTDDHLRRRSIREIERYREQTPSALVIPSHDWLVWRELKATYE
jgi:glyoxylase-like metal-dependent hydrolase (beta-lactamase superfamily II)